MASSSHLYNGAKSLNGGISVIRKVDGATVNGSSHGDWNGESNGHWNGYSNGHDEEEDPYNGTYTNGYNGKTSANGYVHNGHLNVDLQEINSTGSSICSGSSFDVIEEDDEDDLFGDDDEIFKALEEMVNEKTSPPTPPPKRKVSHTALAASAASAASSATKREDARERARKASRELIRERNDTSGGGRRSLKREHVIIKWILRVTHKNKDSSIDFADWIQDGKVLSQVMTTLCFNSVENDPFTNMGCSPEERRIAQLRTQILDYGVHPKYVFQVEDISKKRNTPKVIRCLEEVANLSRQETHIKYDTLLNNKLYT